MMLRALLTIGLLAGGLLMVKSNHVESKKTHRFDVSKGVLLVGDSLAVGLSSKLPTYFPNMVSLAKSGTQTSYWTHNVQFKAMLAHRPSLVLVCLGTNDLAGKVEASKLSANAKKIVNDIHAVGAKAVWLSPGVLPWSSQALDDAMADSGADYIIDQPMMAKADGVHLSGSQYAEWAKWIAGDIQ